jgi:hypothetical protein
VAIWENNQFKSAKRLGGFGMLAITLAACNNDDDDTAAADVAAQLAAAQAAQAAAEAAQAAAEAALADINTAEAAPAAVAVLTTGVDTVVAAASGDSVSSGLVAGVQALQSIDAINMGEGTDTLTAIVNANVSPQMTGVENLTLSSVTNAATVNLSAAPGVTSIHNNGSSTVLTVQSIEAGTALSLSNNTAGAAFTLKATDFTGAADSITLSLNNVTAGNTTINDVVETLNIVSNGSTANVLNTVTTTPNIVNISGTAALTYAEALTTTTAVDASGMSGTLTSTWAPAAAYSYTGSSGVDTLTLNSGAAIVETVNTGTGNDTVTVSGNLADTDVINGGDGTDTIAAAAADFVALTTLVAASNNITGFETVRTTDALDRAIVIASDVQSTGITTFTTPGSNANDSAAVTMAAGDMTVNLSASLAGAFAITDTGTATTDSVTINNTALVADDMGDAAAQVEAVTVTGYETLNIVANSVGGATSQDFGVLTMAVDTGGASVLNITGNSPMTTTGTTGIATIDASGMTGEGVGTATFTMGGVGTGAATITGSPGRDTLLAANTATTLNGGAGNDVLTGGTAGDTINGGDGIDTIDTGAGATATTADTVDGGAGNDVITVGAGLHNVAGGAGDDTINMAATLSTGDVITGGDGTDTIRLNADATAATAGGVGGFETLQVDNTGGTTNMAAFTGNVFGTITANAAATSVTNATSSITQLELNAASTTSAAFALLVNGTTDVLDIESTAAVAMTGSVTANDIETFTIDSADGTIAIATALIATQGTSITVSGDNAVDLSQVRAVNMATVDASAMTANFTSEHDGTNASVVAMTVTGPATGALDINTGAGADTVTSNAGNDTIDTNNGNDTVKPGAGTNNITMGAGADTFDGSGFAGVNGVNGGIHADTMTGGTGIDTYIFAAADSVAPSSIVTAGANLAAGDVVYYANGVDVITNFTTTSATADDIINGPTGGSNPTTVIGVAHANLNNAGALDMFASGAWDSVAKTFTLTADGLGADTLFLRTAGGADVSDSLATTTSTIVLVGVDSDNLLAANLT